MESPEFQEKKILPGPGLGLRFIVLHGCKELIQMWQQYAFPMESLEFQEKNSCLDQD